MIFDFDVMSRMYREDPEMFELRRKELIHYAIERCPEPQREAVAKLQYELDQIRTKQPEHFLSHCFLEMSENLGKMGKEWKNLRAVLCEIECAEDVLGGKSCDGVCEILK